MGSVAQAFAGAIDIQDASATLTGTTIARCSATAQGNGGGKRVALGGAIVASNRASLTLDGGAITDCSATIVGSGHDCGDDCGFARAGAMQVSGSATLTGTTIARCSATAQGNVQASGGSLLAYAGAIYVRGSATLTGTTIARCSATAQGKGDAWGGAILVNNGGKLTLDGSAITDCFTMAFGGGNAKGGILYSSGTAMLLRFSILANGSANEGGGIFNRGNLIFRDGSRLRGHSASTRGAALAQLGEVTYVLPAPLGTWVAARKCEVYRRLCPEDPVTYLPVDPSCPLTADACAREVSTSAAVSGTVCQPVLFNQPCDWTNSPGLLGETVEVLSQAYIEVDYPYICSAGLLRSADPSKQTSSLCGGLCPAGFACLAGQDTSICPAGRYCPIGTSVPFTCPSGTYSTATGLSAASQCKPCPLGFWCSAGKAIACPIDTYNHALSADDQGDCTPCPSQAITLFPSAKSLADCKCEEGYYNADDTSSGVSCKRCPLGALCEGSGAELSALRLRRGYYRSTNRSVDVRRCPDASANCTSTECDGGLMSGCLGEPQPCVDGLTGHYCSASSAWSRPRSLAIALAICFSHVCLLLISSSCAALCINVTGNYYVKATTADSARCDACDAYSAGGTMILVIVLAVFVVSIASSWTRLAPIREKLARWFSKNTVATKLKMLFAFLQIAVSVESTYLVVLPNEVHKMLVSFSMLVTVGFEGVGVPLQCMGLHGFMAKLITALLMPLIIVTVAIFCVVLVARVQGGAMLLRWAILLDSLDAMLRILFLAYPIVLNVAFRAFACEEFDGVGEWMVRPGGRDANQRRT